MSDALLRFVEACGAAHPVAAERGYPPFTTGLRSETPLNSAPYVFEPAAFRATFGTSARRRRIIAGCERALAALGEHGITWHMLLVGGSFIRAGDAPSDLDGLLIYSIGPDAPSGIEQVLARFADRARELMIDLKFCPADVHPMVLVKRAIFFSNLFSYDRAADRLVHGTVMLVPARGPAVTAVAA